MHQKLTNFRALDATFVGDRAWVLGSADCLSGSGTCDAIEYSADGGRSWRSEPAPHADVPTGAGCTVPCVAHLRFASSKVGYAWSGSGESVSTGALFLTTDGGRVWHRQSGGAEALETLDGNVIRVRRSGTGGCPPGCRYYVQTAPVGSTHWTDVSLPGGSIGDRAELVRSGRSAFLEGYGNPAGGGQTESATLWTSSDDGARWTNRGEPCPRYHGAEVDSAHVSAGTGGALAVLCSTRTGDGPSFVIVSTDGGASFHAADRSALGSAGVTAFAAASATTLIVSSDETYRSTDGGDHFQRLGANGGSSPGKLTSLGFASSSVAHGLSTDGTLWTTTDAGRTWSADRIG